MKIGLLQYKQNELYLFGEPSRAYSKSDAMRWQKDMIEQNIALIHEAGQAGANVIVTSEAINYPGKYLELVPEKDNEFFDRMEALAKEYQAYLFLGAYYQDDEGELHNAVFVYNPEGQLQDCYHKIHLVGSENDYLIPGEQYKVISTEYGKIGILICYDCQFPEAARELALMGADLIVCPTWGWEEIYGHARAYENGVYVAAAMGIPCDIPIEGLRTPSEVVAPDGTVLVRGSCEKKGVTVCECDVRQCRERREKRLSERHPSSYVLIR